MTCLRTHSLTRRLIRTLLMAWTAHALVCACGAKSGDPAHSTDTGNPPVVDDQRVQVVAAPDGVTVIGSAGAVEPGGAEVVVTNLDTGASATTTARGDGSFEVDVDGSVSDDYRVEARADGRSTDVELGNQSADDDTDDTAADDTRAPDGVELLCLASTDDVPEGSTSGPRSCDFLWADAQCLANEAVATADKSCELDDDCVKLNTAPRCNDPCGHDVALSLAGAQAVGAALEDIDSFTCAEFDAAGCAFFASGCPGEEAWQAACVGGTCEAVRSCDAGLQAAEQVVDTEVQTLATGCEVDDDCFVVHAPTCVWACGGRPIYVAQSNVEALATARSNVFAACADAVNGADCGGAECTTADPAEVAACRAGVCVDSTTPVTGDAASDGEPPSADLAARIEQALGEFEAELGPELVTCGRIDCDAYSPLRSGEDALTQPTDADFDVTTCFMNAWSACTPAKLESWQPCIDCPSFETTYYVTPSDDGACKLVFFTDWSTDPFGGCQLLKDECSDVTGVLATIESCPWIGGSDCGDSTTAVDNPACRE